MGIADCPDCRRLMEDAGCAIALHLKTLGEISTAVNGGSEADLDALLIAIQQYREAELDAVQKYENHRIMHEARVRAAGNFE
ncbi:MAG TPA: hypothetical protein VG297_15780 [Bryobacteraceae bacterium]|jgi:hypothetical protein|nr:hypothetical protein [Bryobacteraceae bacterium]